MCYRYITCRDAGRNSMEGTQIGPCSLKKLSSWAFQRYMTILYRHVIYHWKAPERNFSIVCPTQRYINASLSTFFRLPYIPLNGKSWFLLSWEFEVNQKGQWESILIIDFNLTLSDDIHSVWVCETTTSPQGCWVSIIQDMISSSITQGMLDLSGIWINFLL